MLKRIAFVLGVCAVVAVAYGAANKIKSFTPELGIESEEADGMAILNYASGDEKTIIQLILTDFSENTTYDLFLVTPGALVDQGTNGVIITNASFVGPFTETEGELTTNEHGSLNWHSDFPGDISESDIVITTGLIDVDHVQGTDTWTLKGATLRAIGRLNP
jgi:hypothetical protein